MSLIRLFLVALLLLGQSSYAAAHTVEGSALGITVPPSGLSVLTFTSKDNAVDSGNFGGNGDPRCEAVGGGGGALRVNGGPGNDFAIVLPCQGWKTTNGSPTSVYNTDYVYQDRSGTTCSRVTVKHGRVIRACCRGPQVAYTLGAPQESVDVTLRLGSLPVYNCATFGPPPTQILRDGSDGKAYRAKHAPKPASCSSP